MKKTSLLISLLLASLNAHADYYDDSRIRNVVSNEDKPIAVEVAAGQPVIVEFDNDEVVDDVAVSGLDDWKSQWEIVKRGHRLFIKLQAKTMQPRTAVITTKSHSFVLDLKPVADKDKRAYLSKLTVSSRPAVQSQERTEIFADEKIIGEPKMPVVIPPPPYKNTSYTMQIVKEQADIRPREAWDDGKFTYLRFPKNLVVPAIYRSVPGSKEETLINSHVEDDGLVVLHGISPQWNLRLGGSVIGVFNEKYDAVGATVAPTSTNSQRASNDK